MARGDIERRADGEWILRGDPPESTRQPAGGARALRARRCASERSIRRPAVGDDGGTMDTPRPRPDPGGRPRTAIDGAVRSAISQADRADPRRALREGRHPGEDLLWDNVVVTVLARRPHDGRAHARRRRPRRHRARRPDVFQQPWSRPSARASSRSRAGACGPSCPRSIPPRATASRSSCSSRSLQRLEVALDELVLAPGQLYTLRQQPAGVQEVLRAPDRERRGQPAAVQLEDREGAVARVAAHDLAVPPLRGLDVLGGAPVGEVDEK